MCNATNAQLASDSLKNDLVAAAFSNLPKISPNLMGGYFAVKGNSKELSELCFEPSQLLTIAALAQLYPNFRSAKPMPFFTVPEDKEHVKGIKVNLRKDKTLYGGTPNMICRLFHLTCKMHSSSISSCDQKKMYFDCI